MHYLSDSICMIEVMRGTSTVHIYAYVYMIEFYGIEVSLYVKNVLLYCCWIWEPKQKTTWWLRLLSARRSRHSNVYHHHHRTPETRLLYILQKYCVIGAYASSIRPSDCLNEDPDRTVRPTSRNSTQHAIPQPTAHSYCSSCCEKYSV